MVKTEKNAGYALVSMYAKWSNWKHSSARLWRLRAKAEKTRFGLLRGIYRMKCEALTRAVGAYIPADSVLLTDQPFLTACSASLCRKEQGSGKTVRSFIR